MHYDNKLLDLQNTNITTQHSPHTEIKTDLLIPRTQACLSSELFIPACSVQITKVHVVICSKSVKY